MDRRLSTIALVSLLGAACTNAGSTRMATARVAPRKLAGEAPAAAEGRVLVRSAAISLEVLR